MPHVLKVNLVGPDGKLYEAGDTVPTRFGKNYIASLVDDGAAREVKASTAKSKNAANTGGSK